jgi:hypothetical protein
MRIHTQTRRTTYMRVTHTHASHDAYLFVSYASFAKRTLCFLPMHTSHTHTHTQYTNDTHIPLLTSSRLKYSRFSYFLLSGDAFLHQTYILIITTYKRYTHRLTHTHAHKQRKCALHAHTHKGLWRRIRVCSCTQTRALKRERRRRHRNKRARKRIHTNAVTQAHSHNALTQCIQTIKGVHTTLIVCAYVCILHVVLPLTFGCRYAHFSFRLYLSFTFSSSFHYCSFYAALPCRHSSGIILLILGTPRLISNTLHATTCIQHIYAQKHA